MRYDQTKFYNHISSIDFMGPESLMEGGHEFQRFSHFSRLSVNDSCPVKSILEIQRGYVSPSRAVSPAPPSSHGHPSQHPRALYPCPHSPQPLPHQARLGEFLDVNNFCDQIDNTYLHRQHKEYLPPDEIDHLKILVCALKNRITPLDYTPCLRFILRIKNLTLCYSHLF